MGAAEIISDKELKERYGAMSEEDRGLMKFVYSLPSCVGAPSYEATNADQWLMMDVVDFIRKNYSSLKVVEIEHAFNLLATRKLVNEKSQVIRITTYGHKMGKDTVGEVLTAYMNGIVKARVQVPAKTHGTKPSQRPNFTPKQAYELIVDICKREGGIPKQIVIPKNLIHRHLKSTGVYAGWDEERKESIRKAADDKVKQDIENFKKSKGVRLIGEKMTDTDVQSVIKEMCVRAHLKDLGFKELT